MLNHLFVYGTLRRAKGGDFHPYLKDKATFIHSASVPGKLYQVDRYPGAIPAPYGSKSRVYGEVYRLFKPEGLLRVVDEYEECTEHFPQPHEYQRLAATVTLGDGKTTKAWVYWFRRSVYGLRQIPSGDYFDCLS
ncbi:gamma-glutamylcyclotransferase family protein [Methylomonas sp. MgM2]